MEELEQLYMEGQPIVEVYHHPKPWKKVVELFRGFSYNVVGKPASEKFYGVGNKNWWYQWNEPK